MGLNVKSTYDAKTVEDAVKILCKAGLLDEDDDKYTYTGDGADVLFKIIAANETSNPVEEAMVVFAAHYKLLPESKSNVNL